MIGGNATTRRSDRGPVQHRAAGYAGEGSQDLLTTLAPASGSATPTRTPLRGHANILTRPGPRRWPHSQPHAAAADRRQVAPQYPGPSRGADRDPPPVTRVPAPRTPAVDRNPRVGAPPRRPNGTSDSTDDAVPRIDFCHGRLCDRVRARPENHLGAKCQAQNQPCLRRVFAGRRHARRRKLRIGKGFPIPMRGNEFGVQSPCADEVARWPTGQSP